MRTKLREQLLLLPDELPWLIRLRWLAGAAIILGAAAHGIWSEWTGQHVGAIAIGALVLLYNTICSFASRRIEAIDRVNRMALLVVVPILLDLVVLTMLVAWTGGVRSPLLGLYVLHMILSMLLLPTAFGYGVAAAAVAFLLSGLWISNQLPNDRASILLIGGWTITLLLTAFVTNHITARLRRQQTDLSDQQGRLHAILDTAADGIITINERGIIQSINPAAASIFGYSVDEMLGKNVSMLMPEPDRSRHNQYLADYLRTGHAKIIGIGREVHGRKKDGTVFPLELAISEVNTDGTVGGRFFTGILRDITERKKAEDELRTAHDTLKRQQSALVQNEKVAAMGKMAAGVAHEIANPLASMDSIMQLARRRDAALSQESVESLGEQVHRVQRIVRELTTFAHPDGAGWQTVQVGDLIREALRMVRYEHRIHDVDVHCECDHDGCRVRVVPQQMHQVLVNLVINALDALEGADSPRLVVRTRAEDTWRIIEVMDNGPGIDPETIGHIFEPFFTTKPVGCGTGLGLSISYSIVQQHGGELTAQSTPGEGTTFAIALPAHDESNRSQTTDASPAAEKAGEG